MARARNIKPGFFRNELLAELPPLTRLLFAGLWTVADREGRLEDRPKRIKADVLPYDDGGVEDMLDALHEAGFIVRYVVEGERYIQVVNFGLHQNPHVREGASTIPVPPGFSLHRACTGLAPDKTGSSPADFLNLIPDSPISDSLIADGGVQGSADAPPTPAKSSKSTSSKGSRIPDDFTVTPAMLEWATAKGMSSAWIERETEKFKLYWQGEGRTKADWGATWRTWMLKGQEQAEAARQNGRMTPQQTAQEQLKRAARGER